MDGNEVLLRKNNESEFEHIKRLVYGKLVYKSIDEDYTELAPLIFKQELSSSECRKRMYGIKRLLEVQENEEDNKVENNTDVTVLKHDYENYEQFKSYKETIEINKDGSYTSDKLIGVEDESKLKDENFLLKVHSYDPKTWQIVSARNSIWNAQLKGGKITKLYASKINVKPRVDSITLEEIEENFRNFAMEYKGIRKPKIVNKDSSKLLEIPLYDVHYGKRAYEFEVGENIDEKVIEERYLSVIQDIINRTKHIKFEKILFPIGSDLYNSDTIDNTTTRGTRQDNVFRWQEMFLKGVQMVIKAIDMLSECAPVEAFYVMGNHDTMSSYYATQYLNAWYRNDDNVTVDISPLSRKYIEFGKCLIGFTHGDKEGKRIFGLMETEKPEAWGRTKYREWHQGHIHHQVVKEQSGVTVRAISTICGTDAWHFESGYVGNIKQTQAFVWDKNNGLETILHSVIN